MVIICVRAQCQYDDDGVCNLECLNEEQPKPPPVVDFSKPAGHRGGELRKPRNEKSNEGGTELR